MICKKIKKTLVITLVMSLFMSMNPGSVFALSHAISSGNVGGLNATYITLDVNAGDLESTAFTAGNTLTQAQGLSQMAQSNGCIAAINGTYFEAYEGIPVPWGVIIKDGKILHIGNTGSTVGITKDGKLVIDNLNIHFKGYINGEYRSIPWRINHPSTEPDAITIFTPEYGSTIKVSPGALAPVVENGKVSYIASTDFTVPQNGFAIVYNPSVANLVTERFQVGDEVYYEADFETKHSNADDWKNVKTAIGAGPSLIINGQVTANGQSEGFWEAKINTGKGSRTFIGATNEGKILIGTIRNANLLDAAGVCQQLGLINAMCLDGGGSTSLYYNGKSITQGRAVNNGLGFIFTGNVSSSKAPSTQEVSQNVVKPTNAKVLVNGIETAFEAYNIEGNNFFKLRDIAMAVDGTNKNFEVAWDNSQKAINLISLTKYTPVGGELAKGDDKAKPATLSKATICKDGHVINLMAYNINGNNYFKLRDVAKAFDIGITYDNATKTVGIITDISYN